MGNHKLFRVGEQHFRFFCWKGHSGDTQNYVIKFQLSIDDNLN